MFYMMTYDEFQKMLSVAESNSAEIQSVDPEEGNTGTITTKDVTIRYQYDGVKLNYSVIKRHSLASRLASDQFIMQHISHIIQEVLALPIVTDSKTSEEVKPIVPEIKIEGVA